MSYEESSSSSINVFTRQGREDVESFKASILRKDFTKSLLRRQKTKGWERVELDYIVHHKLVSESGPVAHFGAYYSHYYHYWFNQNACNF